MAGTKTRERWTGEVRDVNGLNWATSDGVACARITVQGSEVWLDSRPPRRRLRRHPNRVLYRIQVTASVFEESGKTVLHDRYMCWLDRSCTDLDEAKRIAEQASRTLWRLVQVDLGDLDVALDATTLDPRCSGVAQ